MPEKVLKKRAVPMGVSADLQENAIVVHYETQTFYGDEEGNNTRVDKKQASKVIKMSPFQEEDIGELTEQLLSQCNLINPQKKELLVKALKSLASGKHVLTLAGTAQIENLDQYVDAMYDELAMRIEATSKLLQLAQTRENIAMMAGHDVLMSALGRSLREDGMKSIELGTNIAHIFYRISHFQVYGRPLLNHKAPESLFKMIDAEIKRYQTFFKQLTDQRAKVQASQNPKDKEAYQVEYEKFKKLVVAQDKLMFVALQTIQNLTEIKQAADGEEDLFYPTEKLVDLLSQVLGRKPPNAQLVITCLNYLKRISVTEGGIAKISKANMLGSLFRLYESDPELTEPISRLLFNLAFDPQIRQELGGLDVYQKLDDQFMNWNTALLEKYQSEFAADAPLQDRLKAVIANHANRKPDPELDMMIKRASAAGRLVMQLFNDDQGTRGFQATNIGSNLTAFTCLCKEYDKDVMEALQTVSKDPKIATKIVKNNLLGGLTDQFERTKDPVFMKLFTGLAGAIPQEQRAGKQDQKGGASASQEALYENAAKIADIAITTGDKALQKQALTLIAQAPAKHVKPEQAIQITQMALDALAVTEKDLEKKIAAVGVVAMMMSRAKHVQLMCDNGDLKKLPDQLLDCLQEGFGKTPLGTGAIGIDFTTAEFDMMIVTLVCILKACTYKVLRQSFAQRPNFLQLVLRCLYNQPRAANDPVGFREADQGPESASQSIPTTPADEKKTRRKSRSSTRPQPDEPSVIRQGEKPEKTLKPLLIKSNFEDEKQRVLHVLEALADLTLDVMAFAEPDTAPQIKILKFQRYNYEYVQKYLKK